MQLDSDISRNAAVALQVMNIMLIMISQFYTAVSAATKLDMTAPLNPVEEYGVFSVHCRVFELDEGNEVSIYRHLKGQKPQRLSINTGIVPNFPDERFFLANRQMDDGSSVYFLSVMRATQADAGTYICKLFEPGGTPIGEASVNISVLYYPEDDNPQCTPASVPLAIPCGKTLTLNCTAVGGNPAVSLQWFLAGSETPLEYKQKRHGDTVYSELKFTPKSMRENRPLFICKMTSDGFPGKLKTCHVGRIDVLWTNDNQCGLPMITNEPRTTPPVQIHSKSPSVTDCLDTCPYRTTAGSYWILGTVAAALLALIFFIIVLFLVIKLHHDKSKPHYMPPQSCQSDLYAEVENRRLDNRIYMALEKRDGMRCFDSGHDYVGTNNRRL